MGGSSKACADFGNDIKNAFDDGGKAIREEAERAAAEIRRVAEQTARAAEAEARRLAEEARRVAEEVAAEARRAAEVVAAEAQRLAQAAAEEANRLAEEATAAANLVAETLEHDLKAAALELAAAAEKAAQKAKEACEEAIHKAEQAAVELAKHIEAEAKAAVQAAIDKAKFSSHWVSDHLKKLGDIGPLLKEAEKFGHDLGDKLKDVGVDAFDHLPTLDKLHLPTAQQIKNALKYVCHLATTVADVGIHIGFTALKAVAKGLAPNANLSGLDRAEDAVKDVVHQTVENIEGRLDGIVDAGCKAASELAHSYQLAKEHKWGEAADSLKATLNDVLDLALAFIPPELEQAADFMAEKLEQGVKFTTEKMAQGLKYIDMVLDKAIEIGVQIVMHSPVMLLVKLASPEAAAKIEHAVQAAADAVGDMVEGTLDAVVSVIGSAGAVVGALRHGDFEGAGKAAFSGVMNVAIVGMTVVDGVAVIAETAVAAVLCDVLPPEAANILAAAVTMTTPRGIGKDILGLVDNFVPVSAISDATGAMANAAGDAVKAVGDVGSTLAARVGAATGDVGEVAMRQLDNLPVTDNQLLLAGVGGELAAGAASGARKAPTPQVGDDVADVVDSAPAGKANDPNAPKPKESDDPKVDGKGNSKDADKDAGTDASTTKKADETDEADPSKKKKKKDDDDDDNDMDLDLSGLYQPGGGIGGRRGAARPKTSQNKLDDLLYDYTGGIARAAAADPSVKPRGSSGKSGRPQTNAPAHSRNERIAKRTDTNRADEPAVAIHDAQDERPVVSSS